MNRSRLFACSLVVTLQVACNTSSTVGSNEDGAGGAGTGGEQSSSSSEYSSGSGDDSSGSGGAAAQSGSGASATTASGSGGTGAALQGAYVTIRADADLSWIEDAESTVVQIHASATPLPEDFPAEPTSPCVVENIPVGPAPDPAYLDLGAAGIVVTADGHGTVNAIWSATQGAFYAQFWPALPDGTPVHVAFSATSPVLAGQTIDLVARNRTLVSPPLDNILVYDSGTPWLFDWTDVMSTSLYAFVVDTSADPPSQTVRVHCAANAPSSSVDVPANVMGGLVADLNAKLPTHPGSQIWLSLIASDVQSQDEPIAGNYVTSGARVFIPRPVVVSP
jgi:hypothetical protein